MTLYIKHYNSLACVLAVTQVRLPADQEVDLETVLADAMRKMLDNVLLAPGDIIKIEEV